MKFDSPWFDRIRSPKKAERVDSQSSSPRCDHPGCAEAGEFRAPKGRTHEGEYHKFCFAHVRQYNQSYNYFADMPDEAVAAWQKDALTGHRPTWAVGVNAWSKSGGGHAQKPGDMPPHFGAWDFRDPFNVFGGGTERAQPEPEQQRRPLRKVEEKAFVELGIEETATGEEIKARFKTLVKRLHPDANGGDRGTEDKLRAVIQAYNYLKQAGFC